MGAVESVGEAIEQVGDESGDRGVELGGEKTGSVVLLLGDGDGDVLAFVVHDAVFSPIPILRRMGIITGKTGSEKMRESGAAEGKEISYLAERDCGFADGSLD